MTSWAHVEIVAFGGVIAIERSMHDRGRKLRVIGSEYDLNSGYYFGYFNGHEMKILFSREVNYSGRRNKVNVYHFSELRKSLDNDFFSGLVEKFLFKIDDRKRDLFLFERLKTREMSKICCEAKKKNLLRGIQYYFDVNSINFTVLLDRGLEPLPLPMKVIRDIKRSERFLDNEENYQKIREFFVPLLKKDVRRKKCKQKIWKNKNEKICVSQGDQSPLSSRNLKNDSL